MRRLALLVTSVVLLGLVGIVIAGFYLAAPAPRPVGTPPEDLGVESVTILQPHGPTISAWFVQGQAHQGGVLLLHGIRSNRRQMIPRARFLHQAGYSVLVIDLQAHGETPGDHIGFGHPESRDVHNAVDYLRSRLPDQPIGVLGVSLGGAAALLGERPVAADAVVLESVYSSIEQAVVNRLMIKFGAFGRYLAPLLLWQLQPRLDIRPEQLRPLSAIANLSSPVLIVAGSEDRRTRLSETEQLYANAPGQKSLWVVDGASHEDLYRYAPGDYRRKILRFFQRNLR